MVNYLDKDIVVGIDDVCVDGKMNIASAMKKFQEISNIHTIKLGIDVDQVWDNCNGKWIIKNARFEVDRFPKLSEKICVSTWNLEPHLVRFPRCYEITDMYGTSLIRAYTDWCILGTEKPFLKKPEEVGYNKEEIKIIKNKKINNKFLKYKCEFLQSDFCYQKKIRISDIDINGHVNNISYIKMLIDCFTLKEYKNFNIENFEIEYLDQCYEGNIIKVYKKKQEKNIFFIEGTVDNKVVVKGCIICKQQ